MDEYKNYRDLSIKTFLKWVAFYADFKGFQFIKETDHKGRYFKLIDNKFLDIRQNITIDSRYLDKKENFI